MTLTVSLTAPIFRKLTIIPPERRFANNGCSLKLKATANLGEAVLKTCNLSYHLRRYWQVCKFLFSLIAWQIQTNSNYLRLILKYYKKKKIQRMQSSTINISCTLFICLFLSILSSGNIFSMIICYRWLQYRTIYLHR